MQFNELNVIPTILKALEKENYAVPTPIQEQAIPVILSGRDLLGCAQTGTGKTAAFAIPTLQLLEEDKLQTTTSKKIRALIITPTRELALQIHESFCTYGRYTKLKSCVIFGGVSQKPQEELLRQGVDILVATPGRLNDLINQKLVDLNNIKMFILDEADRMLDMGFINDVNRIIAKIPVRKQTLLFSATMPPSIAKLAETILNNPAKIEITPVSSTVDMIDQYLYYVDKNNKKDLLLHILEDKSIVSALVFTRTKHGADRIVRQLAKEKVSAQAIHGDKSQGARQQALNNFKNKTLRVLIATDIAARGIDIDELSHVINYDLPNVPETYVHRIGRTGRAGLGGVAISFCDFDEKELLTDIEQLIGKHITVIKDHPFPLMNEFPAVKVTQPRRKEASKNSQHSASQRHNTKDDKILRGIESRITNSEVSRTMNTSRANTKGDKSPTSSYRSDKAVTRSTSDRAIANKTETNKFASDRNRTGKTSSDRDYTSKASINRNYTGKTSSDRNDTGKSSSDRNYTGKASADRNETGKTSTDKNYTGKSSSDDRSFTNKFATDKAPTNKTGFRKNATNRTEMNKTKTSSRTSSKDSTNANGSEEKKKFRMAFDGTLKEKKSSFNPFNRRKKFK